MDDLFKRLVDLGILRDCNKYAKGYYALPGEAAMNPLRGSNLWRVAGKCLERLGSADIDNTEPPTITVWTKEAFTGPSATTGDDSLPRAICLAFVESQGE